MEEQTLDTPDMVLATLIRTKLFDPLSVGFTPGTRQCVWSFADSEELEDLIVDYQYGDAIVEPRAFSEAYKLTLNEMHDVRRGVAAS